VSVGTEKNKYFSESIYFSETSLDLNARRDPEI
jgi:hypothetical protein